MAWHIWRRRWMYNTGSLCASEDSLQFPCLAHHPFVVCFRPDPMSHIFTARVSVPFVVAA